jgi:malate synthase
MEDAAIAEISRSQIWQWVRHGVQLEDGRTVTRKLVRSVLAEEMAAHPRRSRGRSVGEGRPDETRRIFELVALSDEFPEFLTIPVYELLG